MERGVDGATSEGVRALAVCGCGDKKREGV